MFNLFKKNYFVIPMSKAKENIDNDASIMIIDVRTPAEFKSGHIPKAVNIPLDQADKIIGQVKNKDSIIYVYCLSGARSSQACNYFSKIGYTNVTNIGAVGNWTGPLKK
ncbi:MAG: rhodanese-like domain-containing protein [Peptostreptococcaceae bacterium]|nr:rhodanese-like domain-containing protein [Peptostreptococcaceae bacterium]